MKAADEADFREFASARTLPLRRTAYFLCADWHLAEYLVQATLIKMYAVWPKLTKAGPVDNYVRKVLLRCWMDEQRRPWRRRERRDGVLPEQPVPAVLYTGMSDLLRQALAEVPVKQRAAIVLRYCADLSVADAAVLGCSEGTVKSQTARGLETLRKTVAGLELAERVS